MAEQFFVNKLLAPIYIHVSLVYHSDVNMKPHEVGADLSRNNRKRQ